MVPPVHLFEDVDDVETKDEAKARERGVLPPRNGTEWLSARFPPDMPPKPTLLFFAGPVHLHKGLPEYQHTPESDAVYSFGARQVGGLAGGLDPTPWYLIGGQVGGLVGHDTVYSLGVRGVQPWGARCTALGCAV